MAILAFTVVLTASTVGGGHAIAQTFNSESTGADGAFNPTTNTTLALPPDGVFNFTTINIPAGVTVRFTRNATNTPVTLLASGNATIAGTINLNGGAGGNASTGTSIAPNGGLGGPGGFDGGDGGDGVASTTGGAGLGPGGGVGGLVFVDSNLGVNTASGGGGGSFRTTGGGSTSGFVEVAAPGPTYGGSTLVPFIGGSGGAGGAAFFGFTGGGGGGGGGAILIASSGTITFIGNITATGGNASTAVYPTAGSGAGGSGGAIRLVANTITGSGSSINVGGGSGNSQNRSGAGGGGSGRIRVEAFTNTAAINFAQAPSIGQPGVVALPNAPALMIASVAGLVAPAAPTGSFANPDILVPAGTANPMTIGLAAANIPLGTTITVTAKPQNGAASSAVSSALAGTLAASTATASVTIPTNQPSVISASATFTLAALPGAGPLFAEGEAIEQVRVAAALGGPSQVTYITKSGREIDATGRERPPTPTK